MIYLQKEVSLLSDVLRSYLETCQSAYDVEPIYFYGTPNFICKAGLKKNKVELSGMLMENSSRYLKII